MKRVLFVSIAFPPKKDPECIQAARYFHYLSKDDRFQFDVLTSKSPTLFMPEDDTLKMYDKGWVNKWELKLFENKYFSFLQRKLWLSPLMFPDSKGYFHYKWRSASKKIKEAPNIIYSRSYPLSSTIAAYHLSLHFKVPWVLHLSDPWEDSPLHNYTKREKLYHKKWEIQCFDRANAICLTSQKSIDFYKKKYPGMIDKFHLFPNVFDPAEVEEKHHTKNSKLKIVYTGGLAGTRSPETFLKGLVLFNKNSRMSDLIEVVFAGPCDRKMKTIIDGFKIPNFKHCGSLTLTESLNLQRSADVLLIIDSDIRSEELAMFFPSKILEYIIAQKQILALTTKNSSTEHVVNQLGFTSIDLNDVVKIAAHLELLVNEFSENENKYFDVKGYPKEFSAAYNASNLGDLLNNL